MTVFRSILICQEANGIEFKELSTNIDFLLHGYTPPLPYLTYQIHTDLFHVQVGLVVDGHSSVTIIHCAERCPGRVVFNKWVMFFKTALKKKIHLIIESKI